MSSLSTPAYLRPETTAGYLGVVGNSKQLVRSALDHSAKEAAHCHWTIFLPVYGEGERAREREC